MTKSKPFRFKQFTIHQEQTAMKVGTDGVLLGAWTNCETAQNILDIGSGTGLVALMLAQRSEAQITGIEIEPKAALQCQGNFEASPWADRLKVVKTSFQEFANNKTGQCFDLIVSNPPYFSSKLKQSAREQARQNHYLPYPELIHGVDALIAEKGIFNLIVPFELQETLIELAQNSRLNLQKRLSIKGHPTAAFKRVILSFGREEMKAKEEELCIEFERNQYTEAYANLLRDYLLIF